MDLQSTEGEKKGEGEGKEDEEEGRSGGEEDVAEE